MDFSAVSDPTDLELIKRVIASGPEPERLVPLEIENLVISWNASELLLPICFDLLEKRGRDPIHSRVLLLSDEVEIQKGQRSFKTLMLEKLAKYFEVEWLQLPAKKVVKVDEESIASATTAARNKSLIVAIGGGTISDIAKLASAANKNMPLVHLQTAASVDGYTDNVSVVLKNGAKRTVPSRWPDAVIADLEVIQSAPQELNLAGFGEALSLFTAPADWELSFLTGMDQSFHTTPRDLLLTFAKNPRRWGSGLQEGKLEAVQELTKVLAIRGIGTGIAGSTACLSGVEHLVSHLLDMRAVALGEPIGLHGAQVGAASLVAAMAWRYLFENLHRIQPPVVSSPEIVFSKIAAAFEDIDSDDTLVRECKSDVAKKLEAWNMQLAQTTELIASWQSDPEKLKRLLPDPDALAEGLKLSGAASTYRDLEQWIDQEIWEWAVSNAHLMRNRFTVIDLLFFSGLWEIEDARKVIAMAEQLTSEVVA